MTREAIRVLLIEDNAGDARLIRELFAQIGMNSPVIPAFDLTFADRLSLGLERLREGRTDVILLDLSLPDSQGLGAINPVQAHAPRVPLIVLTGLDDESIAIAAVRAGAQDYLVKGQVDSNLLARSVRYAIERKRAQEELVQRNRELALLNRAGQVFNSSLNLDEVLARVLEELHRLMGVAGAFWLPDSDTGELVCRQASGPVGERVRGWRLPPGKGIAGWVAQHGESLNVPDALADDRFFKEIDRQTGSGTRSILSVPLQSKEKVIGVLQVLDTQVARFDAADVSLVESLAATVAIAIENARLYADTDRLRAFNENIVQSMEEGIVLEDATGYIIFVNPATAKLLGLQPEELIGRHYTAILAAEHVAKAEEETAKRSRGITSRYETVLQSKEGRQVPIIVSAHPVFEQERFSGVLSVLTDITERKRAEEELHSLSLRDELTGLYNRRGFLTLAEQQLKLANRLQRGLLLLFADLDRMKWINDTLGHPEGDRALVEVAGILRDAFREADIIARWGGDEFVILAVETAGESVGALSTRLQHHLEARNAQGDHAYPLSLSVGMAHCDYTNPCPIEVLLLQADKLMYEQKRLKQLYPADNDPLGGKGGR